METLAWLGCYEKRSSEGMGLKARCWPNPSPFSSALFFVCVSETC